MNKYKKRLIEEWKLYGKWTMDYIYSYRCPSDSTSALIDLPKACYYYIKYAHIYNIIWEHNI